AAASKGHTMTIQLLLENGWDINAQGGAYGSALLAALSKGSDAVARLLLENGADINAEGKNGSALQAASLGSNDALVRLL
ncbi:hypothetical protein JB92DRAFT_2681069, partial [Gautieria morchelliformis]